MRGIGGRTDGDLDELHTASADDPDRHVGVGGVLREPEARFVIASKPCWPMTSVRDCARPAHGLRRSDHERTPACQSRATKLRRRVPRDAHRSCQTGRGDSDGDWPAVLSAESCFSPLFRARFVPQRDENRCDRPSSVSTDEHSDVARREIVPAQRPLFRASQAEYGGSIPLIRSEKHLVDTGAVLVDENRERSADVMDAEPALVGPAGLSACRPWGWRARVPGR